MPATPKWKTVTLWILRILVAALFLFAAYAKLSGQKMMVEEFGTVGLGQWFRYFTGVMQIAGGVLVLTPRLALVGIAMLACTMLGAVITWIAFGLPLNVPIPGVLLLVLLALGWSEYNRSRG